MVAGGLPDAGEVELASRCRKQPVDDEAWNELWNRYSRLAWFVIFNALENYKDSADDVLNITFMRLVGAISRYNPARGKLGAFIATVAHHTALDVVRREKRRGRRESRMTEATPEEGVTAAEGVMDSAATRLREELRPPDDPIDKLIFEETLAGLRIQEIIDKHGVSEKAVRRVRQKTLTEARQIIRDSLPGS